MNTSFLLSKELIGHEQDVRSVCTTVLNGVTVVCTASRDRSIKIWSADGSLLTELVGHEHFVSVVISLSSPFFPLNSIASGGNDKIINIWNVELGVPHLTLIGHHDTVCCLSTAASGALISGSWDKTARIWKGSECIQILNGHTQSVWAVLGLPDGDILTGSADHTTKLWRNGECIQTWKQHTDCVRGLLNLPNIGFASCSNDGVINLCSLNGEVLQQLKEHENYIYNISMIQTTGELVSCSEDRTVKVWQNGKCVQTILHPGSVWDVTSLPNGDIVTACSDNVARIFTRDTQKAADHEVIQAYQDSLAKTQPLGSGASGNVQLDRLPTIEVLNFPGTKDKEYKIIRNGNIAEAYQWSQQTNQWSKIGEVMGQPPTSETQQYDYTFDVDVGDGILRKLGYNSYENPYMVAQKFLEKEELSSEWLDQVAQFIIKNTKQVIIGENMNEFGSSNPDPYTGSNRYATNSQGSTQSNLQKPKHFPLENYLHFETGNFSVILNKILEFNKTVTDNSLVLNGAEEESLRALFKILSETSRYHASAILDSDFSSVTAKLLSWSDDLRFPVIDFLRLIVLHPDGAKKCLHHGMLSYIIEYLSSPSVPNQMLALRFLANSFKWPQYHDHIFSSLEKILDKVADLSSTNNKNLQVALVTVILNCAVLLRTRTDTDRKIQCISTVCELLTTLKDSDSDIYYRILVALGTLIYQDEMTNAFAKDMEVPQRLHATILNAQNQKVLECVQELDNLFR